MGTLFRIELYSGDAALAQRAFRTAFERVAQLDDILSDYKPDSELNGICSTAVGTPVRVSADLFRVLQSSQDLAERSGGAFDVTLGPVIRLWREARKERRLPDPDALQEAAGRCGFRKLHLNASDRTVRLDQAGMQLDVGGIAKGYAAQAALESIRKLGLASALVAASGDLVFGDRPPGQPGWRIGIDAADRPEADFTRILKLSNRAVSTSGGTEQFMEVDGQRYSHIIDPATMLGITREISVTVVAREGWMADGMATAISVLGPVRGSKVVAGWPGTAALVTIREKGAIQVQELGEKAALRMLK